MLTKERKFSTQMAQPVMQAARTSSCRIRRWRCVRPAPAWPCHNLAFSPHRAAPCAPRRSQREALEKYLYGGFNEESVVKQAPCALPTPRTRWPAAPLTSLSEPASPPSPPTAPLSSTSSWLFSHTSDPPRPQVTNGKNAMPAFGGRLDDDDIANVAAYVIKTSDGGWD